MAQATGDRSIAAPAIPSAWIGSGGGLRLEWFYAAPLLLLAALLFARPGMPLDDAYITLHNARALLAGGADPVYAGSTALTGATSAVHLVLIAGFGLLLPLEFASKAVSLLGILLYAGGVAVLLRRSGCAPEVRLALFASALLVGYTPHHLLNGLETGLAMAAIVWTAILFRSRWLALLCGTMPFVRPELALLAAAAGAWHCAGLVRSPLEVARFALLGAAAAAPWLLLYLVHTGSPVPNTGAAKIDFFAEAGLPAGERAALLFGAFFWSLIGPFLLAVPALARIPAGRPILLFLAGWTAIALVTLPGGLWHNHFRYLALFVPALILGWSVLLRAPSATGKLVAGLLAAWALATSAAGIGAYLDRTPLHAIERAAAVVRAEAPADATILVHDAGYLAWALPDRRMADLVGLKSSASAPWHAAHSAGGDRDAAVAGIAAETRAQFFVALADRSGFWGSLADPLEERGWRLQRIDRGGTDGYAVYRLERTAGGPGFD